MIPKLFLQPSLPYENKGLNSWHGTCNSVSDHKITWRSIMQKKYIESTVAPKAIGPYSQAVVYGDLMFLSGMLPIEPSSGDLVEGDITTQANQVLKNIQNLLEASSSSLDQVLKTTIFLKDLEHFQEVNRVYGAYLGESLPARSCIEVSRIPKDALIEIEVIAATKHT
jgi:2-iminobutanoate/2-iminopropanoate deaminase